MEFHCSPFESVRNAFVNDGDLRRVPQTAIVATAVEERRFFTFFFDEIEFRA
jgi:hypothetical protein